MMDSYIASPIPPVPNIPNTSLRPAERRRPSPMMLSNEKLPEKMGDEDPPQPRSPEVLSHLISSLSAISTPVENHFNSLPKVEEISNSTSSSTDSGPSNLSLPIMRLGPSPKKAPSGSPSRQNGFGMDYGAYKNVTEENKGIDEAAMPPVIRFVKPSASTSLPRAVPPSPSALNFKKSLQSLRSREDVTTTGMLSTEQPLKSSSASIASSTRSSRSRTFRTRSSKDVPRSSDSPSRLRNGTSSEAPGLNIFGRTNKSLRPTISNRSLTDGTVREPTTKASALSIDTGALLKQSSSLVIPPESPKESIISVAVSNPAVIPSRRSSLRHSMNGSPRIKQANSSKKRFSSGSRELRDLNIDPDLIEEDHQTVRRIRELQEAKEKREKDIRRESRRADRAKARLSMPNSQVPQRKASESPHSGAESNIEAENHDLENVEKSLPASAIPQRIHAKRSATEPLKVSAGNSQMLSNGTLSGDLKDSSLSRRHSNRVSPLRHNRTFSSDSGKKGRSSRISGGFDRPTSANSIEEGVEAYIKSPRLTQRVRHPQTGRVIAFSEVGDPEGFAVFCCVGMGLTRYLTAFYDELARTLKLRLITPDRPGIGESDACFDGTGTPLGWADDVTIICSALGISKFSLLAHSAGAIYALAIALRMPAHVRGRVHLMAPWIPPSQMTSIGESQKESLPAANVPYSQKLLRMLPASFLKAANSSFLTARSASLTKQSPRSKASKRRSTGPEMMEAPYRNGVMSAPAAQDPTSPTTGQRNGSMAQHRRTSSGHILAQSTVHDPATRQATYDELLTQTIWDHATLNANPAVDLITCLERRQTIGFKYVDITRSVVIHHGSKDTRVPVDNVRWLGKMMRRCEVRILEGEGHGLMANAGVMGSVLGEVAKEWEDWWHVTQGKGDRERKIRGKVETASVR